ncbi:MAG TPA: polysaccharide deacetylase family protein, partial [Dehalococcoidia bacterium]
MWPVVNVEWFEPGGGGPAIQPHLTGDHDVANSGWREYGNREGIRRLADVFRSVGIPASAAVNADVCTRRPDALAVVLDAGWEVVGHGKNNSRGHAGMTRDQEVAAVAAALDTLARATGRRPEGWLTPGFSVTPRTPEVLAACDVRYTADVTDTDVPYVLE